jgi:3-oxoadipate enol-lactonase
MFAHARSETDPSQRLRAQTVASPVSGDITQISAATLLLAGEVDRVVPAGATLALAQLLPDARTVVLPGVGHVAAIQAPELLATHLIDFFLATSRKDL